MRTGYEMQEKKKILIVEDESIIAMSLRTILELSGYDVCALASTGEQAVENVEEEKPDLVIMDIGLSDGIDGIEAGRQIKERFSIPVVFVTGYAEDGLKKRAGVTKPYEYLVKPIQRTDLERSIERMLIDNRADITKN